MRSVKMASPVKIYRMMRSFDLHGSVCFRVFFQFTGQTYISEKQ